MKKIIYQNKWLDLYELDNKISPGEKFYGVKPPDYVTTVALDSEQMVFMVSQYRPVIGEFSLETPGGQIDEGQSPEEAINQELIEELGHSFGRIERVAVLHPDVGRLMNKLYIFKASLPSPESIEPERGIEVRRYSSKSLARLIASGELKSAYSIAALSLVLGPDLFPQDNLHSDP